MMKLVSVSLVLGSALVSQPIWAMGAKLPQIKNERVSEQEVLRSFQLRATDGSYLKFLTEEERYKNAGARLPQEKDANYNICEPNIDVTHFIAVTDISIKLLEAPRALTSEEALLLQKTPRCAPYSSALKTISILLGADKDILPTAKLESMSLTRTSNASYLDFKASGGKTVRFKVNSGIEKIRDTSSLTQVQVLPELSGQAYGIRFEYGGSFPLDPGQYSKTESCEYTRVVTECRYDRKHKKERCERITITEPGERTIETNYRSTLHQINVEIYDSAKRVVLDGQVHELEQDDDSKVGPCYPLGY